MERGRHRPPSGAQLIDSMLAAWMMLVASMFVGLLPVVVLTVFFGRSKP